METEKNSIKEAIKSLRKQIIDGAARGGNDQRARLLALAFIRGRKYPTIERTTEAQNLCPSGKKTYYTSLANNVAYVAHNALGENGHLLMANDIFAWMKDHYLENEKR